MPETNEIKPFCMPASRKRLLLSIYLDFLVVGPFLELLLHYAMPSGKLTLVKYVLFSILEVAMLGALKWSPGMYLLSMRHVRSPNAPIVPEGTASRFAVVDSRVWSAETILTVLLGMFLVLEGGKSIIRWTMWTTPQLWFGTILPSEWSPLVAIAEGIVLLIMGALVLRMHPRAPAIVTAVSLINVASILLSWDLVPHFAEQAVTHRRAYQGLAVRDGEIALAKLIFSWVALAILLAQVVIVGAYRRRFRIRNAGGSVEVAEVVPAQDARIF